MFDELDKQNINSAPTRPAAPGKAEDIFSEVDKTVKPEAFRPRDVNSPLAPSTVIPAEYGWKNNKLIIFGLLFGGLFIIIGGGYLGLRLMSKNTPPAEETAVKEQPKPVQTEPEVTAPAEEIDNVVNQPIQPTVNQPVDSDQDGLTDEEEAALGTNSGDPDSDQDGLTDREEAKVYGTDPLKADTDGDGYPDGQEVKNGFNPKGPGKLLEINNQ